MKRLFLVCIPIVLSGCTINTDIIKALAKDHASFCANITGSGYGGVMAITPVPMPGGGFGQGQMVICRTNEPGSAIIFKPDGGIEIHHGK